MTEGKKSKQKTNIFFQKLSCKSFLTWGDQNFNYINVHWLMAMGMSFYKAEIYLSFLP